MMKISLIPLFSVFFMSSCAQLPSPVSQDEVAQTSRNSSAQKEIDATNNSNDNYSSSVAKSVKFHNEYNDLLLSKQHSQTLINTENTENTDNKKRNGTDRLDQNINYYVRGLMQDLVGNLQYVNSTTPLAVTTFPLLGGDYNKTNLLGKQMAESFIHEVHKFGIPVIDFKTTDYIRVTPDGDFIMSQDYLELKDGLPIRYVLAGTMVRHQGGYLVNARILGVESKAVVASAQSFIPADVSNALIESKVVIKEQEKPNISLVQGK